MNDLMMTVLSLSLAGSVIIAILFLCKPLYKKRLSKRWQYYIWLVVIVRLLVPISFEVNLVESLFNGIGQGNVFSFSGNEQADGGMVIDGGTIGDTGGETIIAGTTGNEWQISSPTISDATSMPPVQNVDPALQPPLPIPDAPYTQNNILSMITPYIWLIWIAVAAILFIRKITIYQGFVNYIKAGRVPLENMADLERFGKLVEQANIKRMVGIYTNSLASSPMLIGFFKPYIVLPTADISESDFRHTIMHELTHYKRGDMFYKWLVQFTMCLHWFNPFVYLMGREINNACEFSCDEAVIKTLDNDGIKEYGDTLLNALGFGGEYKNSLSSVTLSENKKILEERLDMIKNFKKKPWLTTSCAALLAVVLVAGAGVIGVYGLSSPQTNQPPNQVDELQVNAQSADFVMPTLSVHELHSRIERPDGTITPEAAAEIVARYIWDNFGVSIDGSVVFMNYQYTQARMRTHADDEDVMVGAWSFRVGDETMAATNMIFDFMGILNAVTGEMIAIFPSNSENQITANVPFGTSQATPPSSLPSGNRQILLTNIQSMENRDDVFEFSYDPQTNVIWISNTGERADVPPNHVNVRCADTGEIFHVQILETIGGVPQLAFFVDMTDDGSPRLVSIDNTTRPNIIADGNITIGLFPSQRFNTTQPPNYTAADGTLYATAQYGTHIMSSSINLANIPGQLNISQSGFFRAENGQTLTLEIVSTIEGGTVDLFLFAPDNTEHRFTFGHTGHTTGEVHNLVLTEGVWAYNAFGIFRSGDISIVGRLSDEIVTAQATQTPLSSDGLRQAGDVMRAIFPQRFPNAPITGFNDVNFNGSWDTIGGNLEINLLNADLRIVLVDEGVLGRNRQTSSPNDYRRVFVESSDWSTAFRSGNSAQRGVYIWDNDNASGETVTLFIPTGAGQVFSQANIHLQNGNVIINEIARGLLAESVNINVVNGDVSEIAPPSVSPLPVTPLLATITLTDAIRIARNHIGLPLASGGGFSTSVIEIEGRSAFHFWVNGCEVLTNLSIDAIESFYEFKICQQTGEILMFAEGTYPPNARRN